MNPIYIGKEQTYYVSSFSDPFFQLNEATSLKSISRNLQINNHSHFPKIAFIQTKQAQALVKQKCHFNDSLIEDTILEIARKLSAYEQAFIFPSVCKKWNKISKTNNLPSQAFRKLFLDLDLKLTKATGKNVDYHKHFKYLASFQLLHQLKEKSLDFKHERNVSGPIELYPMNADSAISLTLKRSSYFSRTDPFKILVDSKTGHAAISDKGKWGDFRFTYQVVAYYSFYYFRKGANLTDSLTFNHIHLSIDHRGFHEAQEQAGIFKWHEMEKIDLNTFPSLSTALNYQLHHSIDELSNMNLSYLSHLDKNLNNVNNEEKLPEYKFYRKVTFATDKRGVILLNDIPSKTKYSFSLVKQTLALKSSEDPFEIMTWEASGIDKLMYNPDCFSYTSVNFSTMFRLSVLAKTSEKFTKKCGQFFIK